MGLAKLFIIFYNFYLGYTGQESEFNSACPKIAKIAIQT